MDNMSYEVYESIISNYADDDDELFNIFNYLYNTSNDKILKSMIKSWANKNNYYI